MDVTVSYLAMTAPAQFRPSTHVPEGLHLERVGGDDLVPMAKTLYREVGGRWHWRDRLGWSDSQWAAVMHRPGVELWVARRSGDAAIAGYFELGIANTDININYFGLVPAFMGRGIGGWLLTRAVERGWALGAERITLNTCTLDGEAALPNYRARGFQVVRTVHQRREVPDEPG